MSLVTRIIEFSQTMYEQTGAIPARLELPPAAFDALFREAQTMMKELPVFIPGTLAALRIETGYGVLNCVRTVPTPVQREDPKP